MVLTSATFARSDLEGKKVSGIYRHRRSIREERRHRRALQRAGEIRSVQSLGINVERGVHDVPDSPARMAHLIFHRPAIALRRVAPIVLGDEFFRGARGYVMGLAHGLNL